MYYAAEVAQDTAYLNSSVAIDCASHYNIPIVLTSTTFTYNPQLSPSVTLNSSVELVISFNMLVLILLGNVTDWHDSRMIRLNPVLSSVLLPDEPATISLIFPCGRYGPVPMFAALALVEFEYLAQFEPALGAEMAANIDFDQSISTCIPPHSTWLYVREESTSQ